MKLLCFFLSAGFCLAYPSPTLAKHERELGYRKQDLWSASIRMLRVDYGFEISDADPDTGYILFSYKGDHKTVPASLEIIYAERPSDTRASFSVPAMPSYVEIILLDRLEKKLRADYGAPLQRGSAKKKKSEDSEPADETTKKSE